MMAQPINPNSGKLLTQGVGALLIILFTYTAVAKLSDLASFEGQMLNQPLPSWINRALIGGVPALEIAIVLLLIFKRTQRYGLMASAILMSAFTIYVGAVVFHFFGRVPCSCGGVLKSMSWEVHLIFNLAFTVMAVIGAWIAARQ